jgi:Na+/H+-dicarboxylate symporter
MKRLSLTTWSILALAAGLGLGIVGHKLPGPFFEHLEVWTKALGGLWVAALQLTVLPLVITHLLATICAAGTQAVGKLGLRSFLLFVGMLIAAGVFAILLTPQFVKTLPLTPQAMETFSAAAASAKSSMTSAPNAAPGSFADWISKLIPTNLFEALGKGDIFPLLLFTGFFALAVTRLPGERRQLLTNVFQGLAEAMLQLTRWILVVTPIGVFALTYTLAFKTGVATGGMLGAYVTIVSSIMLLFTALLYPVSAFLGRTSIKDFARAVAPAQMVAISTRSSIAALPALVEGGRDRLRLPSAATSFVLPLCVSLFKVNRPISSVVKLTLVAHVYGVPLRPTTLVLFLATVVIISFTAPGIPQSGPGLKTLPAFLAAGVPVEGVIVLEAIESIPDIFKTLLNVTGDMSAATLLTRSHRMQSEVSQVESTTAGEGAV